MIEFGLAQTADGFVNRGRVCRSGSVEPKTRPAVNLPVDAKRRRHERWGFSDMTPSQVFIGTFILVLIFAALVAFLTLSAAHGAPLLGV